MKAKIRKTGEIVDIISYNGTSTRHPFDHVSFLDSKGVEHNFEPLPPVKEPDWQALRHQYAGMALLGFINAYDSKEKLAKLAIEQADALIEELKKK